MGFLCRQGRIRMEVVVGLLMVIGTMLEGSEGLRCYEGEKKKNNPIVTCDKPDQDTCVTFVFAHSVWKGCHNDDYSRAGQHCFKKIYGQCRRVSGKGDHSQPYLDCVKKQNSIWRTTGENATENSLQSRQGGRYKECACFTNLCNGDGHGDPAGRSTPNAQVILGTLVATSLFISKLGLGSL